MSELLRASRVVILGRHGDTEATLAKAKGSPTARIQGLSPDMPLAPAAYRNSAALGITIGRRALQDRLHIIEVHASDTVRTRMSRYLGLAQLAHTFPDFPPFKVMSPTKALWEHRKGALADGGLEGMLRTKAYPDKEAADHPDFLHGAEGSGGETPNQAGKRWLEEWFRPLTEQSNFQPRNTSKSTENQKTPTMVAIGHTLVNDRGIGWLLGDTDRLVSDRKYKVDKPANALILAEIDNRWQVLPERLVPTAQDLAEAEAFITSLYNPQS